jgi:hypothetical protein
LDFSLREILAELTDENAPEFLRGGEVAGAGFVLKSVAEDNGALGHTRIYGLPPCMRFTITTHKTPKRNFPVGGKNTLG